MSNLGKPMYQMGLTKPQKINNKIDIDFIFGTDSSAIKEFIKKEKIDIRKEGDLIN